MDRLDAWDAWDRLTPKQVKRLLSVHRAGQSIYLVEEAFQHDQLMSHLEVIKTLSNQQYGGFPAWAENDQKLAAKVEESLHLLSCPENAASPTNPDDGFQSSPLADLTPEIRGRIFAEALPGCQRLEYTRFAIDFHHGSDPTALLRTCKQIRDEAASYFYARNDLVFPVDDNFWPRHPKKNPEKRPSFSGRTPGPPLDLHRCRLGHWLKSISSDTSKHLRSVVIYDPSPSTFGPEELNELMDLRDAHSSWNVSYGYPALEPVEYCKSRDL